MGGNRQNLISRFEKQRPYKVILSKDAIQDIREIKHYILKNFKYIEYAENFSKKMRAAIKALELFSKGYERTGYIIEGLDVYYKPHSTYLIFFVVEEEKVIVIRVLKDRMYWQSIIDQIKSINR